MPLASVTRMAPASATRPDAVTAVLFEATWPLLDFDGDRRAAVAGGVSTRLDLHILAPSNVAGRRMALRKPSAGKQRNGKLWISEILP